jgi:hypothetical protein
MLDLTLYAESEWVSPWVFHAMVALEEKRLPYPSGARSRSSPFG